VASRRPEVALLGRITVACHGEALNRWLAPDDASRTLAGELDATFTQVSGLVADADRPSGTRCSTS